MPQIENRQVFGLSVAAIMGKLDGTFPMPTNVGPDLIYPPFVMPSHVQEPRLVQPDDPEYSDLFGGSLAPHSTIENIVGNEPLDHVWAVDGDPVNYWTPDQIAAYKEYTSNWENAHRVFDATLSFLVREGYVYELTAEERAGISSSPLYVLTSKGFSHLNKRFAGNTIRDEFEFKTAKRFADIVKQAGEVTSAGKTIIDSVSLFLNSAVLT